MSVQLLREKAASGCRKRVADAMIYFDVKGFTDFLDRLESDDEYLHLASCWQGFRDRLLAADSPHGEGIYVANRIGDACLLFCFNVHCSDIFHYIVEDLQGLFDHLLSQLGHLPPGATPAARWRCPCHVKVAVIAGGCPYYETARVPDRIVGGHAWSRLDFFSPAINKLVRMDALPEADDFVFLCNRWLRDELVENDVTDPGSFIDLGHRRLKGFTGTERVFGFGAKTADYDGRTST